MSELLLKLDISLIVIAVGRHVVNAQAGILVADNDFTILVAAIL